MPLADTLNRNPGDILKSDDWNIIIKEIDRLETAKINRDGADTLKGPLTIAESLKVNSNVTISGNLSVTNVLEIGTPPFAGNTGGNRDWMQKGIKINWDSDSLFIGLKNEGTNRKDAVIAWGDDPQDDLRFVNVLAGGEVQGKELMRIKPSGNVGIGTNNPIASLDIASASRTGTHPTAVKGLYITGDFNADNDGVEFRHSNATQGIGFGFNTIYAAGSNANQDLGLKPKGTGEVKVSGSLSVSGIVKAQALTLSQSGGQSSGMASFMSKNPEPPYINWYHSRSGADQDLKRYGYIQAGDDGIKEFRFVAENGANFKFSGGNLTVSGDLSVTGSVNFSLQTRQMLNLWSTVYGIGIQGYTQYFRSDRNFAWYKGGSHNDAELNAGGGTSLMTLDASGTLKVNGAITPSVGNSENNGIMFPKNPGGGGGDAAWIRYYVRGGEATTFEIGTSNDSDDHIALIPNAGNVGIGTPNPDKGKLHIEGFVNYQHPNGYRYFVNRPDSNSTTTGFNAPYSLYASAFIGASEFNAFSDLRIKEIKGTSDSQADLQTLLQIQVTDYYYKDKIAKGNRPKKKVIGQQIATVYPQAVSTHVDTVPDILEFAIIAENWVTLNNHNLKTGDKVKIFWNDNDSQLFTVEDIKTDQFKISLNHTGDIFVYGREVDDFHVVDYDALSMLHISATQELYKIIKKLEGKINEKINA
ncbi:MAG: hypothetical protein ACKOD3_13095 [Phenylobacterium sp.]